MIAYWRVLILIVMVLGSVFAIGLKAFPYGREGVEIVYVPRDSPAKGLLEEGMVITQVNGENIRGVGDWNEKYGSWSGLVDLTANGKPFQVRVNDSLGVSVIGIERTNLDFGLDLRGGTRVILKAEGNVTDELLEQTMGVLETRANLFGLREIKFQPVRDIAGDYFVQVEAAGVGNEIVDELLSRQGKFEAKILKPVDSQRMQLGSEFFDIEDLGGSIKVNGSVVQVNGTFVLKGIEFQYLNRTGERLMFMAKVFEGDDIELVYTDPQRSGIIPQGQVYQFYFSVFISTKGASKFADVTSEIPRNFDVNSGEEFLESSLLLFIDDSLVSSLRIAGSLAGQIVQTPQVTGSELTLEDAQKEKLRLQTILKSGALPVSLSSLSVDVVSPTLGAGFFDSAFRAAGLAGIVVLGIVYARYRRLRVSIPIMLVGLSEAVIILGVAATGDIGVWVSVLFINVLIVGIAWVKKQEMDFSAMFGAVLVPLMGMASWTIDLPAIAGIIAVIGTGVEHQIIIADEALKERTRIAGIREHLKRAFFIIFGAAGTTIVAMIPLMFVGVGLVRGFAITTIVGVLIGVLITRPAYAKIVERIV